MHEGSHASHFQGLHACHFQGSHASHFQGLHACHFWEYYKLHAGVCGGHYAPRTTASKIMRAGYYQPTVFKDVHAFVRVCQEYQLFFGKLRLPALPLSPIVIEDHFQQWRIEFVGPFDLNQNNGYKYILTCKDYFTQWVQSIPAKKAMTKVIVKFLE